MRTWLVMSALAALLSGCATVSPTAPGATATVRTANGTQVGTVTATTMDGGVHVMLTAQGMPPGIHGVHLHMVGRCEGPDFTSAGPHWNPGAAKHGTMHGVGHAGDLPNMTVAADGSGKLDAHASSGSFADLLDADGGAIVVHAGPDDMMTDPAGNSGARIACGVLARN